MWPVMQQAMVGVAINSQAANMDMMVEMTLILEH